MAQTLSLDQLIQRAVKIDGAGKIGINAIAQSGSLTAVDLSKKTKEQILRALFSDNGDGTFGLNIFGSGGGSITIDSTPTNGSANAVSSDGVFDALATKQATLVSATNIKTVNGSSLLGSGDLTVNAALTVTTVGTAIFQYEILTGTPVIGYTKTGGAGNGVMTCTGGTIKLRRFTDDILAADLASTAIRFDLVGTGVSVKLARPIPTKYLLNATDALADASTNASTSNQVDIDNTPPVKYGNIVTTGFGSMSVRLDNVSTDIGLDLQW